MAESTVTETSHNKIQNTESQVSTQSSSVAAAQTESTGSIVGLQKFLKETIQELQKISWPDRNQVIRETLSVIVLVTIITAAVIGFDLAVAKVVFEPLDHLARHMGGGIGAHR